jgi:hypothetical protein
MNEILISNDFKPKAILLNILISADCCAESNTELCPGFIPFFRSEDFVRGIESSHNLASDDEQTKTCTTKLVSSKYQQVHMAMACF